MITAKITRITASEITTLVSRFPISILLYVQMMGQRLGPQEAPGLREALHVQGQQRRWDETAGLQSVEVAQHLCGRAIRDQAAIGHQQHAVGIDDRQVDVVRDEHDGARSRAFAGWNP